MTNKNFYKLVCGIRVYAIGTNYSKLKEHSFNHVKGGFVKPISEEEYNIYLSGLSSDKIFN